MITGTGVTSEWGASRGGDDGDAPSEYANYDGNGGSVAVAAGANGEAICIRLQLGHLSLNTLSLMRGINPPPDMRDDLDLCVCMPHLVGALTRFNRS